MENQKPMDQVNFKKIERTMKNLTKNSFVPYYAKDSDELKVVLASIIKEGERIALGGSMTLAETGVTKMLQEGPYDFLSRSDFSDMREFFLKTIDVDTFVSSANAISETGWILNVDGIGNRVAATIFGPKSVIIIAGVNKIVRSVEDTFDRVKKIAAPANNIRLNTKNPCTESGTCMNCKEEGRICSNYVLMGPQGHKGRTKVILVNENFGY